MPVEVSVQYWPWLCWMLWGQIPLLLIPGPETGSWRMCVNVHHILSHLLTPSDLLLPVPVGLLSGESQQRSGGHPSLVVSCRVAVPSVGLSSSASVPNLPYWGRRTSILIFLVNPEKASPRPRQAAVPSWLEQTRQREGPASSFWLCCLLTALEAHGDSLARSDSLQWMVWFVPSVLRPFFFFSFFFLNIHVFSTFVWAWAAYFFGILKFKHLS